jgi:hypothetical protein
MQTGEPRNSRSLEQLLGFLLLALGPVVVAKASEEETATVSWIRNDTPATQRDVISSPRDQTGG